MFDKKDNHMNATTMCPLCGEGQVTSRWEEVEQNYGGHRGMVPLYFRNCSHCGSDFSGPEESQLNKRAMMAFRKRVDGLMSGARVAAVREKHKLTQAQAARLLGGGPVAFSKYENDDVAQSAAMDTLLRLIDASESAFWTLVDQKGMRAEFVRTTAQPAQRHQTSYLLQPLTDTQGSSPLYQPKEFRQVKDVQSNRGTRK
jgi:HTH-type transcriptional regulator/antitoxin MqsA